MDKTIAKITKMIWECIRSGFFGYVTVHFQGGKITTYDRHETFKEDEK